MRCPACAHAGVPLPPDMEPVAEAGGKPPNAQTQPRSSVPDELFVLLQAPVPTPREWQVQGQGPGAGH